MKTVWRQGPAETAILPQLLLIGNISQGFSVLSFSLHSLCSTAIFDRGLISLFLSLILQWLARSFVAFMLLSVSLPHTGWEGCLWVMNILKSYHNGAKSNTLVTWIEKGPFWRGRGGPRRLFLIVCIYPLIPLLAPHMLVPDKGILEWLPIYDREKIEQIQNLYSSGGIKTQGDSVTYHCTALHKMASRI